MRARFSADTFHLEGQRGRDGKWTLQISSDGKGPALVSYLWHFFQPPSDKVAAIELVNVNPRSIVRLRARHWPGLRVVKRSGS